MVLKNKYESRKTFQIFIIIMFFIKCVSVICAVMKQISFNKNIQQSFTCYHMLPKRTKFMLLLGLKRYTPQARARYTCADSRGTVPASLLYAIRSERIRRFSEQAFYTDTKARATCLLVCVLGVIPAGWHSYMHVLGWVTVVRGEAQAQERHFCLCYCHQIKLLLLN